MFKAINLFAFITAALFLNSSCSSTNEAKHSGNTDLGSLELNIDVQKYTLDNGLRLLLVRDSKLPIASIYTFYDVGGRYERKGTTGATHFLEHMMFKKTKNFPAEYFSDYIETYGGNSNAYTTFDNTVYYENIAAPTVEKMIELEAERMANLMLEEVPFEKERQVVLEERKMRYENRPSGKIHLAMMKAMFKGTPYGGSVIGDAKDVKDLDRKQMLEFYHDFYAPNNAIMVIVGDINPSSILSKVKKTIGKIPMNKNLEAKKSKLDDAGRYKRQAKLPYVRSLKGQSKNPMFRLAFPAVSVTHEDSYALDFLSDILGTGTSSYLVKNYVVSKSPRLSKVYSYNYGLKNGGIFVIGGELLPKKGIKDTRRRLLRTLKKSCSKAITPRAVQKTKNMLLKQYYEAISTNDGLASFLGSSEFFNGDYKEYKKQLKSYSEMTVDQVRDVCRRYISGNEYVFLSIWDRN
ncbi:peptidase, M16 family [Bacteriovorax sp. BAL6_X]|uniref:M16 family metallopeptidase n=1 Tax=Bacteriovorax sp. BAL6_X TaxID=1201290 RepID=UPI00038638CD|nr:pitrilysin family protein [Bacteriovorax sp. BAL6_X]EPZ49594.1 peptidase, M16 family [Bacteriovorax sp. BAL6_X]